MMRDTGGMDIDGEVYPASWYCEGCDVSYSWPVTPGLAAAVDPLQTEMLAIIAEHDAKGCPGRPDIRHNERLREFPKDLYLQAEDFAYGVTALSDSRLELVRNRRFADLRNLQARIADLLDASKAVRPFDRTGHAGSAAQHLDALAEDVHKKTQALAADVAAAEARFLACVDHSQSPCPPTPPQSPAVAVEPPPTAPAAAGPKPGPHLASVAVFDPDASPGAQLAAFDRAAKAGRADRLRSVK